MDIVDIPAMSEAFVNKDEVRESRVESRREPRVNCGLKILIWGIDAQGTRFAQSALARNVSEQGALVTGIDQYLRTGDLVGVQYGERSARYRIVWWRNSRTELRVQAAVQKLAGDECPWREELQQDFHGERNAIADRFEKVMEVLPPQAGNAPPDAGRPYPGPSSIAVRR